MISQFVEGLRRANRLVAGGMFFFDSPGHMLSETDRLIRLIRYDPAIRARSPLVLLPPTAMAKILAEILRVNGVQAVLEPQAIVILREIQLFHPDLVLDIGQAHWKLVLPDPSPRRCGDLYPLNFAWALRREEFVAQLVRFHEAWNATRGQLPLRDGLAKIPIDPAFFDFLGGGKYAVLQIKARVGNGTARLLPGDVYGPALGQLKDEGYKLVLGGREPMLEDFRRYGVIDYAGSPFANPRNDFHLFARASIGLVSPSGAGLFCDTLGIPCCQVGSWTLIPHPSEKTLMVPSRVRRLGTTDALTFREQVASFREMYDDVLGPAAFDAKRFEDIPPDAEEISAALRETIAGPAAVPPVVAESHRERLRALDPAGTWSVAASRMSSTFLLKHPEYLN
jgi:putative glycosyltransferase (TIGR04372 family)